MPRYAPLVIAGLLCLASAAAASPRELDDDPKCARGECVPARRAPIDEDDPKLGRGYRRPWATTRLQLSYRFLMLADPFGGSLPFNLVQFSGFPVSRYVRVGVSLTGGASTRESAWLADVGFTIGAQYPWRVSPFIDAGFSVGLVGAYVVDRRVVSYEYRPLVEVGADVFVTRRFHLTIAVGWSHPIYGGVDANAIQAAVDKNQTPNFDVHAVHYDSFTVRVGFGL